MHSIAVITQIERPERSVKNTPGNQPIKAMDKNLGLEYEINLVIIKTLITPWGTIDVVVGCNSKSDSKQIDGRHEPDGDMTNDLRWPCRSLTYFLWTRSRSPAKFCTLISGVNWEIKKKSTERLIANHARPPAELSKWSNCWSAAKYPAECIRWCTVHDMQPAAQTPLPQEPFSISILSQFTSHKLPYHPIRSNQRRKSRPCKPTESVQSKS